MFTYNFRRTGINTSKLDSELRAANVKVVGLNYANSDIQILTNSECSVTELNQFASIIALHNPVDNHSVIKQRIQDAMVFGSDMMAEYATKRVLRGCGLEDTKRVITKLSKVQAALVGGSLYVALSEIESLIADSDIPQSDIDEFSNKLRSYLGLI